MINETVNGTTTAQKPSVQLNATQSKVEPEVNGDDDLDTDLYGDSSSVDEMEVDIPEPVTNGKPIESAHVAGPSYWALVYTEDGALQVFCDVEL